MTGLRLSRVNGNLIYFHRYHHRLHQFIIMNRHYMMNDNWRRLQSISLLAGSSPLKVQQVLECVKSTPLM